MLNQWMASTSDCQTVELLCRWRDDPFGAAHLPLAEHVHRLDPGQDSAGSPK